MKETNMQNVSKAGNIHQELNEIEKLQKNPDSFLTLWTNTCTGYYTVVCC